MKNTLIVNRKEAVEAYIDSMTEYLRNSRDGMHPLEYADELIALGKDINQLLSPDLETSRLAFEKAFRTGFTMMMLPREGDTLERWSEAEEDFQVVVFTAEGKPVGTFSQDIVQW